ncbi:hypothetical protein [Nostoc sp.]
MQYLDTECQQMRLLCYVKDKPLRVYTSVGCILLNWRNRGRSSWSRWES